MALTGCLWWAKGLFGGLFVLMVMLILRYGDENESSIVKEGKRWTADGVHLTRMEGDDQHPFLQNYWYRYVYNAVRQRNMSNCYVCSVMPHHSEGPTLDGKPMNKSQVKCASSIGGVGYQHSGIKVNDTDPHTPGLINGTCDRWFWIDYNVTKTNVSFPFSVLMAEGPDTYNHTVCYDQSNGTIPLGNTTNCDQIAVNGEGAPVKVSGPSNGTYWVDGVAWLCGNRAYFVLPPNWYGICAPVFISDHTYVVSHASQAQRTKRSSHDVKPHDSIWGTDVPDDQKLWTTGGKVLLSLFPSAGVGKLFLRVETLTYRLGLFMNASIIIDQQQNEELDVTRQMVIQNRMALDLLTAAQGGVCVLLNQTCCTYIPDNVHSSNMTNALQKLKDLQTVMAGETGVDGFSWLSWFTSGSWWTILMKICVPFLLFFMLFFCCFITVIPCLRMLINSTLHSAFRAQETVFLSLTQNMETEPEEE